MVVTFSPQTLQVTNTGTSSTWTTDHKTLWMDIRPSTFGSIFNTS